MALCERARVAGWVAGFLARRPDLESLEALVAVKAARLVVIDYAETRIEQLEDLFASPLLRLKPPNIPFAYCS